MTDVVAARALVDGTNTTTTTRMVRAQAQLRCPFMRAEVSLRPCPARRQSAREGERTGLAAGVPGDPADRHVDPVTGQRPVLLGLAAPEPVLPVLPGPGLARGQDGADEADLAGLGFPPGPGLGPFAGGGEEQVRLPVAGCDRLPGRPGGVVFPDIDDDFRSERRRHG